MGESDSKKPSDDVGYTTDIPEDILDAAVDSVEQRIEESKDEAAVDEDESGIEISVEDDELTQPPSADEIDDLVADVQDDDDDGGVDDEVTPSQPEADAAAPEPGTGEWLITATAQDLLDEGMVYPQIVEFLEAEQERARAAQERMLRALAETENIRRRLEKQKDDALRFANQDLIKQLLPVLDNLQLCIENADDATDDRLKEGVELTLRQWQNLFEKLGVKAVEAEIGTTFDPAVHEAVMQDPDSELPSHSISKVLQGGFTYHERLLRPAMVAVSMGGASAQAQGEGEGEGEEEEPEVEETTPAPEEDSVDSEETSEPVAPAEGEGENAEAEAKSEKNPLFGDDDVDDWVDGVDEHQA